MPPPPVGSHVRRRRGGACTPAANPSRVSLTEEREAVTATAGPLALHRYRLGRRLGAGGFGAVHEAHDERLDRRVAVKVIPADGSAPERARREAMAAARLEHPGIVALFDAGEDAGARYLVSELVDGRTFAQLQADGELSDRDVLRVGLSLCDALEHAHERGVVHRDVKPQNVIVPDRPRSWRGAAKLTDFGVATLAGDDALTRTGDVVGTLAYMAPEQASGKRVDAQADVYALALVLYEALAGVHPVRGSTPAETARRVGGPVAPLARHRRDLPPELCAALDRGLRVAPVHRGTLEELGDALEDALVEVADEGGAVARHPAERAPWLPPVPRGLPRLLHAAATGALVAVTAALAAPQSELPWLPAAAGAALVTLLLPRLGWGLAVLGTAAGLLLAPAFGGEAAAAGTAVVLLAAALPVPFALGRSPRAWTLPAFAPLLGLAGLAGAFPALAGRARHLGERAALGALGAWWLLLAETLTGHRLLFGPPTGAPPAAAAQEAISEAAATVGGVFTSGGVVLLALWAAAAVALPWLVRGVSLAADLVLATAWSAGLASATAALGTRLGAPEPRGLVVTALVAGVAAVVGARTAEDASLRSSAADDDRP